LNKFPKNLKIEYKGFLITYKSDNNGTCPHCGAAIFPTPNAWLKGIDDGEPHLCPSCNKTLNAKQSSVRFSSQKKANLNFNISFFIIIIILSALVICLNRTFSVFTFKEDSGQIVYEILLILIVSFALSSGKIRQNFKYLAIWFGIFMILITGYSYRHELSGFKEKILVEIIPAKGIQKSPGSISFPVSSDGHFYIRAEVNGTPIIFLADTGASHIVLTPADAEKLGYRTDELRFNRFYETANGTVRGSSILIDDLRIDKFHIKAIGASINEAKMRNSLLGMTFFKRLKSYEVKNDVLTLYLKE
jgi:aspartyl protease family protein